LNCLVNAVLGDNLGIINGVLGYLEELRELHDAKAYIKEIKDKDFTLDTNVIVLLAEKRQGKLLDELASSNHFVYLRINDNEIYGLAECGHKFDAGTNGLLADFRKKVLSKKNPVQIDVGKLKDELTEISFLLPRSVATEFVIGRNDSLINRLIAKFDSFKNWNKKQKDMKNPEFIKVLSSLATEFEIENKALTKKMMDYAMIKFAEMGMNTARINLTRYENSLITFKSKLIGDIRGIVFKSGADFSLIINRLEELKRKSYKNDINFVAQTISKGIRGISSDDDVITMFELHAAKKVLT